MMNRLLSLISVLLVSMAASAQLQVISPNGGEVWQNGPADNHVIVTNAGDEIYLRISYSPDGGSQWLTVAYGHCYNGENDIIVYASLPASDNALIRVEDYDNPSNFDVGDGVFTVEDVVYYVYYPEENDIYYHGEQIFIQWSGPDNHPVNIDFSDNNGISWTQVATSYTSYYYTLQAPLVNSNHCFIRISDATDPSISSLSAAFSVLSPPQVTVIQPNGGEVWTYGQSYPVSWSGVNLGPYVAIKVSTDGGVSWLNYGEAASSPTGGSTEIAAPWIGTSEARVRISDYYYGDEGDMSDSNFTVLVPDFIVFHPYEWSIYHTNEPFSVDWHAAFETETDIAISVDNGVTFETVLTNVPAGQNYAYLTAPSAPTEHCVIKVTNSNDPSSFGISPTFRVWQSPVFTLQFPNGGEVLDNDSTYTITWDYTYNQPGWSYVQVEFSADSGLNWTSIGWLDEDHTSLEWTTPHETSPNCLIRVQDPYATYVNDVSDATFSIEDFPALEICMVSVDSASGKNIITWDPAPNTIIDEYVVMKEGSQSDVYDIIGTVPGDSLTVFIDYSSNPDERAGRYKLSFSDAAGNVFTAGDYHETMHLSISKGINDGVWNLSWNPYIGKPITSYNIYRGTSRTGMTMIATISGNFTTYTDLKASPGTVYYMVEIVNPDECGAGLRSGVYGSRSNIATNFSVGMGEQFSEQLIIYPNPATDIIRVAGAAGEVIRVCSVDGVEVFSHSLAKGHDIDISALLPGVYLLKSEAGVARLVKQ